MSAQTITISTVEVCAGQEVLLPVTGSSLLNIGALTLYIGFDTVNLVFDTIENINPQLTGMSTNIMSAPSQLAFAWSNTIAVNFLSEKLFDIKFIATGQNAPVYYNPGCELAEPSGIAIPVSYVNGSINEGLPAISVEPNDTTITEGGHAVFSVLSPNAISYFWKESQDQGASWLTLEDEGIYSGTHTGILSISPVPLSFNHSQYQCVLTRESCVSMTTPATLTVDELTSSEKTLSTDNTNIFISPVPICDHALVNYTMPEDGSALIQVMSLLGQLVSETALPFQQKGHHHILLNTPDWRAGVYFVKLTLILANERSSHVVKIIKNS